MGLLTSRLAGKFGVNVVELFFYARDLFVEELRDRINRSIVRWPSVFVGFRFILLDRSLSRFQVHYTLTDPI